MHMPKIPFLIEQFNHFYRDLADIKCKEYKFSHMRVTGATLLNTSSFLCDKVEEFKKTCVDFDNWAHNPVSFDTTTLDISDGLCKLYGELVEAGNEPAPNSDPRDIYSPDEYQSILEFLFSAYSLAEIHEKVSMAKMIRGVATLMLNGGILPMICSMYPAVLDGSVPDVQIYFEDDLTEGKDPKLMPLIVLEANQLFFTEEEIQQIEREKALEAEREEQERIFENAVKNAEVARTYLLNIVRDNPDLFTKQFDGVISCPSTQDACRLLTRMKQFIETCRVDGFANIVDAINKLTLGNKMYLQFDQTLQPELVRDVIGCFSGVRAVVLATLTQIDESFEESWSVGDIWFIEKE